MATIAHQACLLEDAEVFLDCRLGNAGLCSKRVHRLLSLTTQAFEKSASGRISQGREKQFVRGRHETHNATVMS